MTDHDTPITTNTILRWGGAVVGACGLIVTGALTYGGIRTDLTIAEADRRNLRQQFVDFRNEQTKKDGEQDGKLTSQGTSIAEIQRKLDVVVALLQRIDRNVNKDDHP